MVAELLDNGADVNGSFGQLQTRPLQWAVWQKQLDIVRLLLRAGALQSHFNTLGWNIAFFCWPGLEPGQQCMLEYLNLLAEDTYQELEVADTEGWTVLHRVAAYGQAAEVKRLLELGAKPEQTASPLNWNAIHHAVYYGNYPAFEVLVPHYSDIATMTDERGWTLLHIAASAGHYEILLDLLKLGADTQARSRPFRSHMPESLWGKACTPREAAAAQSVERERSYLDALQEAENDSKLEFWEAVETLS